MHAPSRFANVYFAAFTRSLSQNRYAYSRMNRLRSTIGMYGFHELKLWSFLKASIRPTIIRYEGGSFKFIDRDPHWYSRRIKEAIHIRIHLNSINRDSGIEIPECVDAYNQTACDRNMDWTGLVKHGLD